ncbi:glycosyltransferase [Planomonospora sp. ID82291]|nr:glycosyltransferase [Planomonospora sp. ID82291]
MRRAVLPDDGDRAVLPDDRDRWDDGRAARGLTSVEIVIPVLNEERALPGCIRTVHRFLTDFFPPAWTVTIVDNGSTDATWETAQRLSRTMTGVRARRLERRGKGIAVKEAWRDSGADIVAFMDVDLSTGLHALLPLVSAVASGHCEIAIGTRLAGGSRIERGVRRELISRLYNGMLRIGFAADFTDATCGFKAARTDVVRPILDRVEDDGWFFDTELLLVAQYNGARIVEIPVDWVEDADSRVDVWRTAAADFRGLARVSRAISRGRARVEIPPVPALRPAHPDAVLRAPRMERSWDVLLFSAVGLVSTALHVLLYRALRDVFSPEAANLVALSVTSLANTEANRRWTFNRACGPDLRTHARAGTLFVLTYLVTTAAIRLSAVLHPDLHRGGESLVLVAAAMTVVFLRFTLLKRWVFGTARDGRDGGRRAG